LGEERYILSAKNHEVEVLTRFYRLQETVIDPVTIRHLGAGSRWSGMSEHRYLYSDPSTS
jgi:hypothetical protein